MWKVGSSSIPELLPTTTFFIYSILPPPEHKLLIIPVAPEAVERGLSAAALAPHAGILQDIGVLNLPLKVALVATLLPMHRVDMLQLQDGEDLRQQLERLRCVLQLRAQAIERRGKDIVEVEHGRAGQP